MATHLRRLLMACEAKLAGRSQDVFCAIFELPVGLAHLAVRLFSHNGLHLPALPALVGSFPGCLPQPPTEARSQEADVSMPLLPVLGIPVQLSCQLSSPPVKSHSSLFLALLLGQLLLYNRPAQSVRRGPP